MAALRYDMETCSNHSKSGDLSEKHGLGDEYIDELARKGHAVPTDGHGNALLCIDPRAERKLRWKIDICVMPLVMLMYLWCFIDRANIGNARLYHLEQDLGMHGYDYNIALTCFYVSYVLLEYPIVLLVKIIGPGKWIPFLVFGFGLMSLCTSFVHTFSQLCAMRFLLGMFECGLLPGLAYYLSRWYRKGELVFRLSLYIAMAPLAGAFGGLLAYGIISDVSNIGWLTSWRMLFFVEGLVTTLVGILCFCLLTDRPETARWLTAEEKALAEARIKADTVAITEALEHTHKTTIWSGFRNLNVWLTGFILFSNSQMVQGIAIFLPTIITAQYPHDSAVSRNLRTVPPYLVGLAWVVIMSFAAWRTHRHAIWGIISSPLAILGYSLFLAGGSSNAQYAGAFFVGMGAFPYGSLLNGWLAANLSPDAARASGIALGAVFQNLGGLLSSWIYLPSEAPHYRAGHICNIVFATVQLLITCLVWSYQGWENRQRRAGRRDYRLKGLSAPEIALLGHRHPEFRYTY